MFSARIGFTHGAPRNRSEGAGTDDMDDQKMRRRRGQALEDAILAAAWDELEERGYSSLTFEAVAKRLGTSRPVLYRRWSSRAELALAAIARHARLNPIIVPDLGNLRDELYLLLRRCSDREPPKLVRLIFEMGEDLEGAGSSFTSIRSKIGPNPAQEILDRAVARGEIDPRRLTPRIMRLPTDLARHEMMATLEPLSDSAIEEIVDGIFLPLVARDGARRAPADLQ